MKTMLLILAAVTVLLVGCSTNSSTTPDSDKKESVPASTMPAADNTNRNERDQTRNTTTPLDQQENAADLEITQKIRQAIIADTTLSVNAKNIKIITANRSVTLRGVIANADERKKIVTCANKVAGRQNVSDLLEIASK